MTIREKAQAVKARAEKATEGLILTCPGWRGACPKAPDCEHHAPDPALALADFALRVTGPETLEQIATLVRGAVWGSPSDTSRDSRAIDAIWMLLGWRPAVLPGGPR